MKTTPAEVTAAIHEINAKSATFGETPPETNNGSCGDVATILWERFRDLEITSDMDQGRGSYTHTFLRLGGLYFDVECPEGVADWKRLPIFQRQATELGLSSPDDPRFIAIEA